MNLAKPRWGALRIHAELLQLGFELSQATMAKYMVHCRKTTIADLAHVPGEPLHHVIVLNEIRLRRILKSCFDYCERTKARVALSRLG